MVKRGGKEVITVEIFKEMYDAMKVIANKKALEHEGLHQHRACGVN